MLFRSCGLVGHLLYHVAGLHVRGAHDGVDPCFDQQDGIQVRGSYCRRLRPRGGVDLLAHSSAIEIDDILKDFSPHRAVRAHETDIYREDSIVGNIPLAYVFLSSVMVELRFK